MESNKVVAQEALEEDKSSFPAQGKALAEESMAATEAAASPAAILAFLALPLSLLRHVARGCAGYLGGLAASRLKPAAVADAAAAACQPRQEAGSVEAAAAVTEEEEEEEVVVVQVRSRAVAAPQRPRGIKEGRGGNGGAHRK